MSGRRDENAGQAHWEREEDPGREYMESGQGIVRFSVVPGQ
jgi:hypothetical protein